MYHQLLLSRLFLFYGNDLEAGVVLFFLRLVLFFAAAT